MDYVKDTVFDSEKKHSVHIDPSINTLKKIIKQEGSQTNDINTIKLSIKTMIMLYQKYKKKY